MNAVIIVLALIALAIGLKQMRGRWTKHDVFAYLVMILISIFLPHGVGLVLSSCAPLFIYLATKES